MLILATACSAQVTFTEFPLPTANSFPIGITSGPDGNLWFTESAGNKIGRITPTGTITEFPLPTANSGPRGITSGPDGNLWFTESVGAIPIAGNGIGRITPTGTITEFPLPTANSQPSGITSGPDGNLWFTESNGGKIARITPTGTITEFLPVHNSTVGITSGPGGNLWFTESDSQFGIGRITPTGTITEFPTPTVGTWPIGITSGPDGNLWFTDEFSYRIGRITPTGTITEFPLTMGTPTDVYGITSGPDGNLWFTYGGGLGRITTAGVITEFPLAEFPLAITSGPDGNLWFTAGNKIGRAVLSTGSSSVPLGVNPATGSGTMGTFTFTFSDTGGWQSLSVVNVLINNFLDGRHSCYLAYVVPSSTLVLVDDAGDAGGPYAGSVALGNSSTIIQNSQCAVSLVSASGGGSTLTLVLSVTFKPGFSGNEIQYLAARDASSNSGWQALGVWNVPSSSPPPSIVVGNMSPSRGIVAAGTAQILTFSLSDSKGVLDIGILNVLVNDFIDGRHACYLAYVASANTLLLVNDAGAAGGPFAGGMVLNGLAGTIQNSQCSVSRTGSSAAAVGNLMTLTLNITFQTPLVGNRVVWVAGRDIAGANNTDWQAMGTVSVQ